MMPPTRAALDDMAAPIRTVEAVAGLLGHLSTADTVIVPDHLNPLFEALHAAAEALRAAHETLTKAHSVAAAVIGTKD